MSKLTDAFEELTQVCRIRPGQFEGDIAALARRVFKALGEYPEPVALTALDMWPRQSEWFPTEKELRDLLDAIKAESEREAAARGIGREGTYHSPTGASADFVDRVRRVHGGDYVKSWMAGGINCLFADKNIYVTSSAFDRLHRDCAFIAQAAGVTIVRSKQAEAMLAKYCDDREITFEQKRVRR